MSRAWGVLPAEVRCQLRSREYDNWRNLSQRLLGQRAFPIRLNLKPPTESQAMADLDHLRRYVEQWRNSRLAGQVEWQTRQYSRLGYQQLPVRFEIDSLSALWAILGPDVVERSQRWQQQMQPLLAWDPRLYPVLVQQLKVLETLSADDQRLLLSALQQLQPGMGQGQYLRSLPLKDVDTKFIERHTGVLVALLDALYESAVSHKGGLLPWLDCMPNPRNWLWVRPLCPLIMAELGGLPLLQLPADYLQRQPLPGQRVLVVENLESGLGLPMLDGTVAIFGGGRNIGWMSAAWLRERALAYWGDIDTWGLQILSDVRLYCPELQALMMDLTTLESFSERRVPERVSVTNTPPMLTPTEQVLWRCLQQLPPNSNRLEQERLPAEYIKGCLEHWVSGY